jgi:EAL domain-containing protein (putative c-di-GMP-specific phosphodiesterase class I)
MKFNYKTGNNNVKVHTQPISGNQLQSIDISHLTCWYQPIYDLKDNILIGYEALMRSKMQYSLNPMEIFQTAESLGERTKLDRQLIIKAQQLFKGFENCNLFLNIFPSTLLEEDFLDWWDRESGIAPLIVLELSEAEPIHNWKSIKYVLKELQMRGVKIALDDMGAGYSSLQCWIELEPDYIKLDRYYMMDIINYTKKQRVVESLIKLLGDSTQVIIEGIEDNAGLKIAEELGARYAQGYVLGMPSPINNVSSG